MQKVSEFIFAAYCYKNNVYEAIEYAHVAVPFEKKAIIKDR